MSEANNAAEPPNPLTETGAGSQLPSAPTLPNPLEPTVTPLPLPGQVDIPNGNSDNPQGNGSVPPNVGGNNDTSNQLEASQGGMDPTAERVLISVGSIGKYCPALLFKERNADYPNRGIYSCLLYCLDGLADDEEVQKA